MKRILITVLSLAVVATSIQGMAAAQKGQRAAARKGEAQTTAMRDMCSMNMQMMKSMGGRHVTALPDGSIVIMTKDKLMKYDKDLHLITQVDLPADVQMSHEEEESQSAPEKGEGMQ